MGDLKKMFNILTMRATTFLPSKTLSFVLSKLLTVQTFLGQLRNLSPTSFIGPDFAPYIIIQLYNSCLKKK